MSAEHIHLRPIAGKEAKRAEGAERSLNFEMCLDSANGYIVEELV